MSRPLLYEKPQGVRDFIPPLAMHKRMIERTVMKTLTSWGYDEIVTPTFEYQETFEQGMRGVDDRAFRFVDRTGRMAVLRPDMTAQIARVVGSLLKNEPVPIRLCYTANIFRQQEVIAGRDMEFTQAGVELIGEGSPTEDAEVIALAVYTLKSLHVDGFRLAIGHGGFLQALLAEHIDDAVVREQLQQLLIEKNIVGYERMIDQHVHGESREVLLRIPQFRGGLDVIERAAASTKNQAALEALTNLEQIWSLLSVYEVAEHVQIDLSLQMGLHYYTGAVFEGYVPTIGFPVCAGGRYDSLLEKFGRPAAATGFMIWIERILEWLEKHRPMTAVQPQRLLFVEQDRVSALAFVLFLRGKGWRVIAEPWTDEHAADADVDRMHRWQDEALQTHDECIRSEYQEFVMQREQYKQGGI